MERSFVYTPLDREEVWRFLTYMLVHGDLTHLTVNLLNQLMLGIPMEYINSWWRVLTVYLSGVLSGSLMASIIKPRIGLCGASGGGYALLAASIFRLHNLLKWSGMTKKQRLLEFYNFSLFLCIFAMPAIISANSVSHGCHVFGALAGFLTGIILLDNVDSKNTALEGKIKITAGVALACLFTAPVMIHVFASDYFYMFEV